MPAFWQFTATTASMVDTVEAPDDPSPWRNLDATARVEIIDRFTLGESLKDCPLPTRFRLNTSRKTVPDAFIVYAGWPVISARFRTLLERFDLGICDFYPVDILTKKGAREHGDFFILHVRSLKDTLIEAKTEGKPFNDRLFGRIVFINSHSVCPPKVTLSPAAVQGVDLWLEKRDMRLLYASDALQRACKAQKIRTLYSALVVINDG